MNWIELSDEYMRKVRPSASHWIGSGLPLDARIEVVPAAALPEQPGRVDILMSFRFGFQTLCENVPSPPNLDAARGMAMSSLLQRFGTRRAGGNRWMDRFVWPAEVWGSKEELELKLAAI